MTHQDWQAEIKAALDLAAHNKAEAGKRKVPMTDGLRRAFGQPAPPGSITQEAFDYDEAHLHRLVRLKPGERAVPGDLLDYAHDLRYTEIDKPLLAFLLPFCLEAWRDDLRGTTTSYGAFVEYFYPVLADCHLFDAVLKPQQTAAISAFMRQSILEEMDDQRGLAYQGMAARPYRWIRALTTHGVVLPDVESLWNEWWMIETIGRAVSIVQYASALMYPDDQNPIFAPWTHDGGGGPPCLWDFEGHLYSHRWLDANVEFLQGALTASKVADVLELAVKRLADDPSTRLPPAYSGNCGVEPTCSKRVASSCRSSWRRRKRRVSCWSGRSGS